MISVVSVYNNQEILDKCLIRSLEKQNCPYELITIDNTQNEFKSAAEALNYGGNQAKGEYIMFVHQDMELNSPNWLGDVEEMIKSIEDVGVIGVAGRKGKTPRSNMKHGTPPRSVGIFPQDNPIEVQTVDECLAIVPSRIFQENHFDEETCQGWHLYLTDYCLNLKTKGYHVYVVPQPSHHLSAGDSFSDDYYQTLRKIIKKHKNNYEWIYSTTGNWHTTYPLLIQIIYNKLYRTVERIIIKLT